MKANIWAKKNKNGTRINFYITVVDGIKRKGVINRTTIPAGESVDVEFWDNEEKEFINHPDKETLQIDLESMLLDVRSFINDNRRKNITIYDVKAHFVEEKREKIDFIVAVTDLLDELELKKELSPFTIATHRTDFRKVSKILKLKNISPSLDEVSVNTWKVIEEYCISDRLQNSTTNNILKNFKRWMNTFKTRGLVDASFLKDLKKLKAPIKKYPYLSLEELEKIEQLPLEDKKLIKVRDMILVHKDIGLRCGDLMNLSVINFNLESNRIELITQKNKSELSLPISTTTLNLLKEYDYNLPTMSATNYNKGIKELCRLAGITGLVRTVKYIGNETIEEWVEKHQIIASHTFRRSFITNGLKRGVSSSSMMILVGSNDEKVFTNYNSLTKEDASNEYAKMMNSSNK